MYTWIKWCVHGTEDERFESLQDEFREQIKDDTQTYIFNLRRDIFCMDQELLQLGTIADHMRKHGKDDDIVEILQGDPYFIRLSFNNLEADLSRMQAQHKAKRYKLTIKEAEYAKYFEVNKDDTPPNEQDWYGQLRVLSKWAGFHLKAKELSVMDYVVYLNEFKADVKRQATQMVNKAS